MKWTLTLPKSVGPSTTPMTAPGAGLGASTVAKKDWSSDYASGIPLIAVSLAFGPRTVTASTPTPVE